MRGRRARSIRWWEGRGDWILRTAFWRMETWWPIKDLAGKNVLYAMYSIAETAKQLNKSEAEVAEVPG